MGPAAVTGPALTRAGDEVDAPELPSAETIIVVDGWHPRYAGVLAVAGSGVVAFALVDTNGDGVEVDVDQLIRGENGHWPAGMTSGEGGQGVLSDHRTGHP
ncbi:hypothetical protein [Nocardia sp. NPDC004860]|uniref:hypothetical protein n=1 Tax=Nocardia sp. NPDC004860 TaxID=3154557 RepID=UPI0033A9E5A2